MTRTVCRLRLIRSARWVRTSLLQLPALSELMLNRISRAFTLSIREISIQRDDRLA